MQRESLRRNWFWFVVAIGLSGCALLGVCFVLEYGYVTGPMLIVVHTYMFGLSILANRLLVWLGRPETPDWCRPFAGLPAFLPLFGGWFLVTPWMHEVAARTNYMNGPSTLWLLALFVLGLAGPAALPAYKMVGTTPQGS